MLFFFSGSIAAALKQLMLNSCIDGHHEDVKCCTARHLHRHPAHAGMLALSPLRSMFSRRRGQAENAS